jgi:hypothetical protein
VGDERSLAQFRQQLERHLNLYLQTNGQHYSDVKRQSKIGYDPNDLCRENNKYNIDFIVNGVDDADRMEALRFFSNLLTMELRLRKLPLYGNLEERRERLRIILKVEQKLDIITQAISRGEEGREAALMLISQAIPCIMHMENRVGEKLITVLLAMAADKYRQRTNIKTLTRFAANIQSIVNTRILGSVVRPKQWKVPLSEKKDAVNKVSLSNKKTRLYVDNIYHLINFVFASEEDRQLKETWTKMIQDYTQAMQLLRKKSEYTEQDIDQFQLLIDDFFMAYIEKSGAGKEGVTNYIHMLGSSHIQYYMRTHGNLYKYSQQGWESLNEKFKLSFFNHTQRGGNYGSHVAENERSYLKSIFHFFQREVLWVSGVAEQHFMNK